MGFEEPKERQSVISGSTAAEKATAEEPRVGCCRPMEQRSCCNPEDKAECCGATGGKGCGCR